jgi:ribonuclease R
VYVDGLVHITALGNDYFHFEAGKHRLIGERTRSVYRLGDPMRVRVVRVDLDEARIDFEPAGGAGKAKPGRANVHRRNVRQEKKAGKSRRRR